MTPVAAVGVAVTTLGLGAMLVADRSQRRGLLLAAKPSASVGFLLVALGSGALESVYGVWIFVGLVLSLVGDVFLMFREAAPFRGGLVAFLLGHIAYIIAFATLGVVAAWVGVAAVGAVAVAAAVLRWLMPHVESDMRGPVLAYVVVISLMLVLAVGTRGAGHTSLIVGGAVLFYVSDLFVARDRFVASGFVNRLVGLPLYYVGQVLFALSVAA